MMGHPPDKECLEPTLIQLLPNSGQTGGQVGLVRHQIRVEPHTWLQGQHQQQTQVRHSISHKRRYPHQRLERALLIVWQDKIQEKAALKL